MEPMLLAKDIIVTQEAMDSPDSYDLVMSNIDVVNGLFSRYLNEEEICREALYSYYVDYYLAQAYNGGFSQFVYNCPNVTVFNLVGEGLEAIGAYKHLELFAAFDKLLSGLTEQELRDFLSSDYFGENPTRDRLDVHNDAFYDLNNKGESLIEMNARYLRRHPRLEVVPEADLEDRLDAIAAQITDLEERKAAAEANEKGFYFTLEGEEL